VYVNGRPDHQKGQHDDLIMSVAMATYVAESSFSSLERVTEQTKAMLDSWSVSNNENISKQVEFNPVMPYYQENINRNNQQQISREDYMKYSWLNVTGQGISTTKLSPPDKIVFNDNKPSNSTTTNSNQN
jgi:hypothetical protein